MSENSKYAISDYYAKMSEEIIRVKHPEILACGISVGFISCNKAKTINKIKIVLGECRKVQDLERLFCPFDFLIIIYEPNVEGLTEKQIEILLHHELSHIGIDEEGEYEQRMVTTGIDDGAKCIIPEGIAEGEEIVVGERAMFPGADKKDSKSFFGPPQEKKR